MHALHLGVIVESGDAAAAHRDASEHDRKTSCAARGVGRYQYRDGTGQQYGASHGHGVADGSQTILVGADLKRFFVPLYVGHKGWIGMRLDNKVDWQEVAEIVKRSYRMTASKKAG